MLVFSKDKIPDLDYRKAVKKPIAIRCKQIDEVFEVHTLEGVMKGKAGDWLMVGIHGEMYPIDNTIFRATYTLMLEEEA